MIENGESGRRQRQLLPQERQSVFCPGGNHLANHSIYTYCTDASTFQVIVSLFAKDNKYVYYKGFTLEDADPNTFTTGDGLPHDNKHIYYKLYGRYNLMDTVADPTTAHLVFADNNVWIADSAHVFYKGHITDIRPVSLRLLGNKKWIVDDRQIYSLYYLSF